MVTCNSYAGCGSMPVLVTKIISCPFCRGRVSVYAKVCPTCAADLSLLSDLQLLPYALYNQGLERFLAEDYYAALLKLAAAVELGKDFAEAQLLLEKIAGRLGLKALSSDEPESAQSGTIDASAAESAAPSDGTQPVNAEALAGEGIEKDKAQEDQEP